MNIGVLGGAPLYTHHHGLIFHRVHPRGTIAYLDRLRGQIHTSIWSTDEKDPVEMSALGRH